MSIAIKKQLVVGTVIDYYDGPLLFTAFDKVGTPFLCTHAKYLESGSQYIAVPISRTRLDSFLNAKVDLRSVYTLPETDDFYTIETSADLEELSAVWTDRASIEDKFLPAAGYYVSEPIIDEPLAINRALLEASLDVRESKDAPVIDTYTCADFLRVIQDVLKFGYKKAIAPLKSDLKKVISSDYFFSTQVCGTKAGSFTVQLRSTATGDLNHYVELDRGIQKVVQIFEAANDQQKALNVFRENRGHFVGAFNRLLDLSITHQCSLGLAWRPTSNTKPPQRLKISTDEAAGLKSALAGQKDLSDELVELTGRAADVQTAGKTAWKIVTDDGEVHSGEIEEEKKITLSGIIINSRYTYFCHEVLRESAVGRQHTHLYLYDYKPA